MSQSLLRPVPPENETPPATPPSEEEFPHISTNDLSAKLTNTNQAYQIVEEILLIANELASLPNLKPCSRVNNLFGQLVSLCIKPWNKKVAEEVLEDKRTKAVTKRLREMCAEGEGELERYWAQIFLQELEMSENIPIEKTSRALGI
jgi:hypothetical protein